MTKDQFWKFLHWNHQGGSRVALCYAAISYIGSIGGTLASFCPLSPLVQYITAWYSYICTLLYFGSLGLGILGISKSRTEMSSCEWLYCTILLLLFLIDTHLLIKLFMLGPLWWWVVGGGGGWWHCNYSFKLQGSRGDLESLSLVELDSRPKESNSWTPSLTI